MTTCAARGEVPRGELGAPSSSLLLDAGKGWPAAGCPKETPGSSIDDLELKKMACDRAIKFVVRGLLILLWLYLFNSMREYAISYTDGDTRFSTFAAIVVAVPLAEIFCILSQALIPPPWSSPPPIRSSSSMSLPADDGQVPTEEEDAVFLDLEKGLTTKVVAPMPMPAYAMEAARARDKAAIDAALDKAAPRIYKCIVRALLILLWVYFVDLLRRFIATQDVGVLLFIMAPFLILLVAHVYVFLCLVMEVCGQLILQMNSSQYATLELD